MTAFVDAISSSDEDDRDQDDDDGSSGAAGLSSAPRGASSPARTALPSVAAAPALPRAHGGATTAAADKPCRSVPALKHARSTAAASGCTPGSAHARQAAGLFPPPARVKAAVTDRKGAKRARAAALQPPVDLQPPPVVSLGAGHLQGADGGGVSSCADIFRMRT